MAANVCGAYQCDLKAKSLRRTSQKSECNASNIGEHHDTTTPKLVQSDLCRAGSSPGGLRWQALDAIAKRLVSPAVLRQPAAARPRRFAPRAARYPFHS